MMRDLEPMQELETVVDYSSRLARLGGLIGGVAHQIRNPLNAMTLQLELLRQDSEKGNDTGSRISRIRHEIARLDQAVDALLRFMRPEQLKLEDVNLNDLLVEAGAQVTRPNIRLEYQLSADLPSARIDSAMISEAIKNIIQNAIQAMPNGGMLTIASRRSPDGMNEAIIADQGVGIASENLDRIFDLYFTTKQGGTGLGLSLALRAVELHHGFVEINSRPGQGTTVTIRLPSTARFERTRLPSNQPDQVTR
jgi:signal transduction histidine kinase